MDVVPPNRKPRKQSTRREDRSRRRGKLVSIVASASLGLALLGLAIPRTVAAWASIETQPALEKFWAGKAPSDAELAAGVAGLRRALVWVPSPRRLTNLALLELEQARSRKFADPERGVLLASAEQHLVDGLIANPADGIAWFRLAVVRQMRVGTGRAISVALMQSLDMAPDMRLLWLPRIGMFLVYWRTLKDDELAALRSHLRTIWSADPNIRVPLLQLAQSYGELPVISAALESDAQAKGEFGRMMSLLPKPPR